MPHTVEALTDPVEAHLHGEACARACLAAVAGGWAPPDALLLSLLEALHADGHLVPESPRLRGWCRAVQKPLEQRRPA